jgi:septum formation topological specificity factor MinE
MNRTIELPTALYQRLEKHAAGFHQTPITVIENVINAHEATVARLKAEQNESANPSKYIFNNEKLDKSRLVLKVVSHYVNDQEEDINLYELSQAFPNEIQGSIGIANKFYDVVKQYDGQANKRHFVGEHDLLDLQDGKVAISTEWGASNIDAFIQRAHELGYSIERDYSNASAVPLESVHPDNTYIFNNALLSPSHLVLNVISEYVNAQEEEINLYQLSQAFPNALQGSIGVANKFYDVVTAYDGKDDKHHFVDEKDLLDLQDGKVAVCSQWDALNIGSFIQQAKELGFHIGLDGMSSPSVADSVKSESTGDYTFNDEKFNAKELVLKVITDYVNAQEEDINLYQLTQAFPHTLQGPIGIASKFKTQDDTHHFVGAHELLELQDGKVAVCSEWDANNIGAFIQQARELGYSIDVNGVISPIASDEKKSRRRNKYVFDGEHLGASQLVLKIITDYVNKQEEDINLYQLAQAFPNDLQGAIGIVNKYDDVVTQYEGQVNQRHFVKDQYLLDLQDGKVAICTEWDAKNIMMFIEKAREQGYEIAIDGVNESLAA